MTQIPGGWSSWNFEIDNAEKHIFEEVIGRLIGVVYSPIAVAKQVVSGLNYAFLAKAKGVYPGAKDEVLVIHIYAPLPEHGAPHVTGIVKVNP